MPHNEPVSIEFAPMVSRIPAYPAAGGYGQAGPLVRLASNESPEPPHPDVLAAARTALESVNRYPDPENVLLREALSRCHDVPIERIAVGNGSCDILLALGDALLEPGSELIYAWPSFSVYPHLQAASGATAVTVALDSSDRHDLAAMAARVTAATRLVIVCNPNNPTSTALPPAELAAFVASLPERVCVLIDEAYCEFNALADPESTLPLLARHPNLILLRTFSKVHGLCGLRVGYALCGSSELADALTQVRQPFFCNAVAQAAAVAALAHPEEVTRRVELGRRGRTQLHAGLRALGFEPAASQANFCWFELAPWRSASEPEIVSGLAQRGVLVRSGGALGRDGALRVTAGTSEENARFLEALESLAIVQ
jgi:histidinol-phosphate aminotransferase